VSEQHGGDSTFDSPTRASRSDGSSDVVPSPSMTPLRIDRTIQKLNQPDKATTIVEVLEYVKRSFDDETALDALPLEAAGNSGAWKAWRAYRAHQSAKVARHALGNDTMHQEEWDWDGVWEQRVRKGIDASISDSVLFGVSGGGDDLVIFVYISINFH